MINNKFEVKTPISEAIGFAICDFMLVAIFIVVFVVADKLHYKIIVAVCAVAVVLVGIVVTVRDNIFRVKVENDVFRVRKKNGERYEFNVYEIQNIDCHKIQRVKHGTQFTLTIVAKSEELYLVYPMKGLDELVIYLIAKFDCGVISKQVLSRSSYYELIKYRDRKFIKRF